jgi:DNA mismatch repair protein MutS
MKRTMECTATISTATLSTATLSTATLSTATLTIYEKYLEYTRQYQQQYGAKTIVLMMVGSFFEVYGLKSPTTGEVSGSAILEFSQICQMNVSEKKKVSVNGHTVLMAGFPEYTLERYLQKLSESGYRSVVFVQDEENSVHGEKKKHILHSIHSAGTFIPYEIDQPKLSNHIMSVWISGYIPLSKSRPQIVCGISVINIFTGKSFISEFKAPFENNPTTFDNLERAISVYNPCEIIILYDLLKLTENEPSLLKSIKTYTGIDIDCVHHVCIRDNPKAINCMKQQYVVQLVESFFGSESYETCEEFSLFQTATQSFCYLLNFVQEHDRSLVKNIHIPTFASINMNCILANQTLKQLNIIEDKSADSVRSGRFSSVLHFINRACTPIGKRRINELITAPVFDKQWLRAEYDMVSHLLHPDHYHFVSFFRKQLADVIDLEKIIRQILVKKLSSSSVYRLYESISHIQQIHTCLQEDQVLLAYLPNADVMDSACSSVITSITSFLIIDSCKNASTPVSFQPGIDSELDAMLLEYGVTNDTINSIHRFFNLVLRASLNLADDADYVKINTTERSGSSFQITKPRAKVFKGILDKHEFQTNPCFRNCLSIVKPGTVLFNNVLINYEDLKFKPASTAAEEIVFVQLTNLLSKQLHLEHAIERKTKILYDVFVETVLEKKCYEHIDKIVKYVGCLDVLQCKAYLAKEYRYCKPEIVEGTDMIPSSVNAVGIRHCLIEHIQQNETYVANDITIDSGGILLFGTNAVGKTSLIRALGIAVILAQCGFFVPCTKFVFEPYRSFFTRILGNDNLYKGLSTFGVEMSELRVILNHSDKHSLILGDELCSGTETQSALSIFVAGLIHLHKTQASFLFATHFHEICDYDEIVSLDRLHLKHMAVHYDREADCLVYDRLLKDGPGDNMYGLEVCKSLHLPLEFLDAAFEIRNKYFPEKIGTLGRKVSHFNSQKVCGLCEVCNKSLSSEVHHLEMQQHADKDGFIEGTAVHKHHKANLMALCEECHQTMHSTADAIVKKKTTNGYLFVKR